MSRTNALLAVGCFTVDQVKLIDHFPGEEENCFIHHDLPPANGGGPYNVVKDLALLGAPGRLYACGRLGKDSLGKWIKHDLSENGISGSYMQSTDDVPTSYTIVLSSQASGKRTFVSQSGANAFLGPEDVPFDECRARYFYYGYPMIMRTMDAPYKGFPSGTAYVLSKAQQAGMTTLLDLTTLPPGSPYKESLYPLLKCVHYLFCNETELAYLSGLPVRHDEQGVPDLREVVMACVAIQYRSKSIVTVVVHFQHGCVVANGYDVVWSDGVQVGAKDIVGTNGAGDAFAAGFIFGLMKKYKLTRTLNCAHAVAAISLTSGTTSNGIASHSQTMSWAEQRGYGTRVMDTYHRSAQQLVDDYFRQQERMEAEASRGEGEAGARVTRSTSDDTTTTTTTTTTTSTASTTSTTHSQGTSPLDPAEEEAFATITMSHVSRRLGLWPVHMLPVVIDYGRVHELPRHDTSPSDFLTSALKCLHLSHPFSVDLAGVQQELCLTPSEIWFTYVPLAHWILSQQRACRNEDSTGHDTDTSVGRSRFLLGVAGGPGAGKTTLCAILTRVFAAWGIATATVPMDGYHHPNSWLQTHDRNGAVISGAGVDPAETMVAYKGAPQSFDLPAISRDLQALRQQSAGDAPIPIPVYDRRIHDPRPNAISIPGDTSIIFVEGLFVNMHADGWDAVSDCIHSTLHLVSDIDKSKERLVTRKVQGGKSEGEVLAHWDRVDGPNLHAAEMASHNASLCLALRPGQLPSFSLRSKSPIP